jgi:hypothetical protein
VAPGRVQHVDSRTLGESLRDTYSNISLEEIARNKVASLYYVIGPPAFLPLALQSATVMLDDAQRLTCAPGSSSMSWRRSACSRWRRSHACFHAHGDRENSRRSCGSQRYAPRRSPCGSSSTFDRVVIHTGSLALECFLFAAAMLASSP